MVYLLTSSSGTWDEYKVFTIAITTCPFKADSIKQEYLAKLKEKKLKYTDGVKFVAEKYGAYWLIDAIASYQPVKGTDMTDFQLWELKVDSMRSMATLTCRADSDQRASISQKIEYTDFPESITLYVEGGVLLLPNEH